MIRTRLVWFGVGFSLTGAAISHLVWKDLLVDRFALSSDVKQKFDALEGRIVNLERSLSPGPNHHPARTYVALNDFEGVKRVVEEMETQDVEKCSWSTYSNMAAIYVNAGLFDKAKQNLKMSEEMMKP